MPTKNFDEFTDNVARGYASTATRLAKELAPNNHLKESIHSTVEKSEKYRYIIRVIATGPDARAREYGSGIWARHGPKGKILIQGKSSFIKGRGPYLIFKWDVATSPISGFITNVPTLPDGKVFLKKVEHPGVEAANEGQGYIHPAINQTNKYIRDRFFTDGANAIVADLRAAIRIK